MANGSASVVGAGVVDSYVYVVVVRPYAKIGVTRDLVRRFSQISSAKRGGDPSTQPVDLDRWTVDPELAGWVRGGKDVEHAFHEAWAGQRVSGTVEWFHWCTGMALWARELRQGFPATTVGPSPLVRDSRRVEF